MVKLMEELLKVHTFFCGTMRGHRVPAAIKSKKSEINTKVVKKGGAVVPGDMERGNHLSITVWFTVVPPSVTVWFTLFPPSVTVWLLYSPKCYCMVYLVQLNKCYNI
jgi:hypothetical protein